MTLILHGLRASTRPGAIQVPVALIGGLVLGKVKPGIKYDAREF
jgi:hypothetical protein